MKIIIIIFIGTIAVAALITAGWRLASRRRSLPCPVWLRWFVELDNPFTKTNRAAFIAEQLALEPGMTVLDAGCGPGRLTIPLARRVGGRGTVVAMDLQAGMLARARAKADEAGLTNVEFLHAGLGEGKLARDRFDRAVLVTVTGEIPDRAAAFRELFEALAPGGILSVTEVIFDPHFQTRRTVTRLAVEAGFRERAFFGNRIAYVLHFEKPARPPTESRDRPGSHAGAPGPQAAGPAPAGEPGRRAAGGSDVWSSRAEQVVSRLIAGLPPEQLDPTRTHTARLGALHIGGSMWADYYLRPNGEVVIVGEDDDHPEVDTVYTDRSHVLRTLVWGAQRYPELRELLPARPADAVDCGCRQVPIFSEGKVLCSTCGALGWLPAQES